MSYRERTKSLAESIPHKPVRPSHNCAATGCPNAGSMDGKCFWHWKAEPREWPGVTAEIEAKFDTMHNWGPESETERQQRIERIAKAEQTLRASRPRFGERS